MDIWVDSRRTLALQDVASHLGSTIQQLYFSLNHETISAGTTTYTPGLSPLIDHHHYLGIATLRTVLEAPLNSSKILDITLTLDTVGTAVTTSAVLGQNVEWQESIFVSNSANACIVATKSWDGDEHVIHLSFGG